MTLDRPDLAARLRHLAAELDLVRPVWLQVDLWGEATKVGGCDEPGMRGRVPGPGGDPRLPVQGFMAIPPPEDAGAFHALARAAGRLATDARPAAAAVHGHERRPGAGGGRRQRPDPHRHRLFR